MIWNLNYFIHFFLKDYHFLSVLGKSLRNNLLPTTLTSKHPGCDYLILNLNYFSRGVILSLYGQGSDVSNSIGSGQKVAPYHLNVF